MQPGAIRSRLIALVAMALSSLSLAGCIGSSSSSSKTSSGSSQIDQASAACQRIQAAVAKRPQVQLTSGPTSTALRHAGALQARYDLPAFKQAAKDLRGIEPRENVAAWQRFVSQFAAYVSALSRQVHAMQAGDLKAFKSAANNPQRLAHSLDTAAQEAGATSCAFL